MAQCNICGHTEFIAGYQGRLSNGNPPMCASCLAVERHRIVRSLYIPLRPLLANWRVLQFAPDKSIDHTWFREYVCSAFGGVNSMDMMDTGLPDASFELVVSNHVLEHVQNDIAALRETLRVAGPSGVVHVSVPTPSYRWSTKEWGFPDPSIMGHFRDYGADFPLRVVSEIDGLEAASVAGFDPITGVSDLVYFFSRNPDTLAQMGRYWQSIGTPITRLRS